MSWHAINISRRQISPCRINQSIILLSIFSTYSPSSQCTLLSSEYLSYTSNIIQWKFQIKIQLITRNFLFYPCMWTQIIPLCRNISLHTSYLYTYHWISHIYVLRYINTLQRERERVTTLETHLNGSLLSQELVHACAKSFTPLRQRTLLVTIESLLSTEYFNLVF